MSPLKRYAKKQAKARQRRRHTAHERLRHDQQRAQRAIEALEQALHALGLPDNLVQEIEGRLRRQQKRLGKIFGLMFPPLFGCRTPAELSRVRGWNKNLASQILGALPKRSWMKRLRRLGHEVLAPLWRHVQDKSPATLSRWQWTWVFDDSVFKKYGQQLGLVGTWWSGQEKRVRAGIDGVLLVVVIGDGHLVVPVDFAIRRPDPKGPGAPCYTKLDLVQGMLDACLVVLRRRGLRLPPPMVVADSWLSDSKWMQQVATHHQGTLLVEGKSTYVFSNSRSKVCVKYAGPMELWNDALVTPCEDQSRRRLSHLRLSANTEMLRTACFLYVIGHRELLVSGEILALLRRVKGTFAGVACLFRVEFDFYHHILAAAKHPKA